MPDDIYAKRVAQQRQLNMQEVKRLLEEGDRPLLDKIRNFSDRYQIPQKYIKECIIKEHVVALAVFAKDPTRQKIHERIASEEIRKIKGVRNFRDLHNRELYISRGQVMTPEHAVQSNAKTIDFAFEYGAHQVYASHKYTEQSGGAQDNQYNDLQDFIRECRDNKNPHIIFIAIADGDYYNGTNGRAGTTRMENLKGMCTKSVLVCTIYELEAKLQSLS